MVRFADRFTANGDPAFMSLRDAIYAANMTSGAQVIWLPAWDFLLTIERNGQPTDTNPSYGDLDISDSLTILGISDTSESTMVAWRSGTPSDRVFELLGDYNLDNAVNAADYTIWHSSDGDDDGIAGEGDDYNIWYTHFGNVLTIDDVDVS